MKITITENSKNEVLSCIAALSAALDTVLNKNKALARLDTQRTELAARIAFLQASADLDDESLCAELTQKITALDLAERRIADRELDTPPNEELMPVLRHAAGIISAALTPTYEAFVTEVANGIRQYCPNDAWAVGAARQLPKVATLCAACNPPFGRFSASVTQTRNALQILREIADGNLTWHFDKGQFKPA